MKKWYAMHYAILLHCIYVPLFVLEPMPRGMSTVHLNLIDEYRPLPKKLNLGTLKNVPLENAFNHTARLRRRVFLVTTLSGVATEDLTESNRVGYSWVILCPFARSDPFDFPSTNALCTKNATGSCLIEVFTRPYATQSVAAPRPPM